MERRESLEKECNSQNAEIVKNLATSAINDTTADFKVAIGKFATKSERLEAAQQNIRNDQLSEAERQLEIEADKLRLPSDLEPEAISQFSDPECMMLDCEPTTKKSKKTIKGKQALTKVTKHT